MTIVVNTNSRFNCDEVNEKKKFFALFTALVLVLSHGRSYIKILFTTRKQSNVKFRCIRSKKASLGIPAAKAAKAKTILFFHGFTGLDLFSLHISCCVMGKQKKSPVCT